MAHTSKSSIGMCWNMLKACLNDQSRNILSHHNHTDSVALLNDFVKKFYQIQMMFVCIHAFFFINIILFYKYMASI